ncbi:hypothetical protein FOZ62_031209 [Perkinsus olseni]|uniref:Uncharacterized protein n=1 Tax=Perkinsus olseni TaxID=32597 RepID=A0A7J6Q474_PEROL|nr:hypothetical protein FOZ62_031209 [Perkinsus olseni]
MEQFPAILDAYVTLTSEDVHRMTALAKALVTTEFPASVSTNTEKVDLPLQPTNFRRSLREMETLGGAARESLQMAEGRYQQLVGEIKELSKTKSRGGEYITEARAKKLTKLLNGVADAREGFETCIEKQKEKAERAVKARDDAAQCLQKTDQLIEFIDAKLNSAIRQPAELQSGSSISGHGGPLALAAMPGRKQAKRRRSSPAYNTINKRSRGR